MAINLNKITLDLENMDPQIKTFALILNEIISIRIHPVNHFGNSGISKLIDIQIVNIIGDKVFVNIVY